MKVYSKNQLQRYPIYLKFFKKLLNEGVTTVSSPMIAKDLGYSEEQIRKDLQAVCDTPGRPKKGRDVRKVIDTLESFLGYHDKVNAVILGAGKLGSALARYPGFGEMGLRIVAAFDVDPAKYGEEDGITVYPIEKLDAVLKETNCRIAIITVPPHEAQAAADLAVKHGIRGLWNFAPTLLTVPDDIILENVNLASSLAVLSHNLNRRLAIEEKFDY